MRFGINHPVCWTLKKDKYVMFNKEESLYTASSLWSDEMCILLYFLCLQELSTRVYHYNIYKTHNDQKQHKKAIFKTLVILKHIVTEAVHRDIYY